MVSRVLDDRLGQGRSGLASRLREEIRRWHPDKFRQKVGPRILDQEAAAVMERVNTVAQALNEYRRRLDQEA